jgi:hypothetical protein
MNTKYVLYAEGNDSIDVLNQFPNDFLTKVQRILAEPLIPIPVSSQFCELEDNSTKIEYNPKIDDRVFIAVAIPRKDKSVWTTFAHLVAEGMLCMRKPILKFHYDEERFYVFMCQHEEATQVVLEQLISEHFDTRPQFDPVSTQLVHIVDEDAINTWELLSDYINHIYSCKLSEEVSDFRHRYVLWTLLTPTETNQNTSIDSLITIFAKMNGYKYNQYSDNCSRLYSIGELELPHEEIQNLDDHLENYVTSRMDKIEDREHNNLFVSKGSIIGFIWFCSKSENNPFGYTEEESEYIMNTIKNLADSSDFKFPTTLTTITKSPEKDPDRPRMVYAYGTTVSAVDRSLSDGMEVLIERIYDHINGIDDEEGE